MPKYDSTILYDLLVAKIKTILVNSKHNEVNTFNPPGIPVLTNYSLIYPAIEFIVSNLKIIIDIEVSNTLSEAMKEKWIRHASNCDNFILIVPKEMEKEVQNFCVHNIPNSEVRTYTFEIKDNEIENLFINF
ncbi:MAG: hypothetical protein H0V01_03945 [Bacteroidetes bacterium]|nr:hypothetical protein [Bacteroidota bacterium]HET6243539.1 hypothetical protein [Bacteroidia bacterium]